MFKCLELLGVCQHSNVQVIFFEIKGACNSINCCPFLIYLNSRMYYHSKNMSYICRSQIRDRSWGNRTKHAHIPGIQYSLQNALYNTRCHIHHKCWCFCWRCCSPYNTVDSDLLTKTSSSVDSNNVSGASVPLQRLTCVYKIIRAKSGKTTWHKSPAFGRRLAPKRLFIQLSFPFFRFNQYIGIF